MAFTFDHTLSGEDSNSYVPLDTYVLTRDGDTYNILGANDYFGGSFEADKWNALTDLQKQQFLVKSSTRIDLEHFGGRRTLSNQRLEWPRLYAVERNFEQDQDFLEFSDGNYFLSPFMMPQELEVAIFELAMEYINEYLLENPNVSWQDQERVESYTIGPLSYNPRKRKEHKLPDFISRSLRAIGPNAWLGWRMPKLVR